CFLLLSPFATSRLHFFFFTDAATTAIYTLSLHDALPIFLRRTEGGGVMTSPTHTTLAQARDALAKREMSARELAEAHLAAVEAARPLNAFTLETPEKALSMAEASHERLAKGEGRPLEGIPLGIKDLFCTEGV